MHASLRLNSCPLNSSLHSQELVRLAVASSSHKQFSENALFNFIVDFRASDLPVFEITVPSMHLGVDVVFRLWLPVSKMLRHVLRASPLAREQTALSRASFSCVGLCRVLR